MMIQLGVPEKIQDVSYPSHIVGEKPTHIIYGKIVLLGANW
jgi:hypothetical protein